MNNPFLIIIWAISLVGLGCLISFPTIKQIIRIYRTSTSRINALPPYGLVEIVGKVEPGSITSPISQTPCAFWQVEVKEKRSSGSKGGSSWSTIYKKSSEEPFEIKDETGKIKIRPQQAELILNIDLEESSGLFSGMDSSTKEALQKMDIETKGFFGFEKSLKVYERLLTPDEQIYVLAEIRELDGQTSFADRVSPLLISDRSERELLMTLYGRVAIKVLLTIAVGGFIYFFLNGGFTSGLGGG